MASSSTDKKAEKSYLSSAVESFYPWSGNRSTSTAQTTTRGKTPSPAPSVTDDHTTTHLYGRSTRSYPPDCPPLNVQWFHAVDVPTRNPQLLIAGAKKLPTQPEKPPMLPKKLSPFTTSDSRAIENGYQKLLEAAETSADVPSRKPNHKPTGSASLNNVQDRPTRVPVNEDFLFDVDIEQRELAPTYWLGPVYPVCRGTWFYREGSNLRPCEENLAAQLEEGYLKLKPWLYKVSTQSDSGPKSTITPKDSHESLRNTGKTASTSNTNPPTSSEASQEKIQLQSYRLFGTYMNNIVTFQDAETAWLTSDGVLSWVTSSVYERFAGGGYMSGVKLVRGYSEPRKRKEKDRSKETDDESVPTPPESSLASDERQQKIRKRDNATQLRGASQRTQPETDQPEKPKIESHQVRLQRQLSSLFEGRSKKEAEEEIRQQEEREIQDDYNTQAGETQGREIEHLILSTHGIGQIMSLRMESINFIHNVNVMRKTLKSVYANSADLKALNSESGTGPGNCRVQILPICWRQQLEFPKKRERTGEHDLAESESDDDEYPSLSDITIDGMAYARSLISDLALDILLYQSSYREQISRIVLNEFNRTYRLFKERNPEFKGKVHVLGHSLGSAILFDMLCRQKGHPQMNKHKRSRSSRSHSDTVCKSSELEFEFEVEDFYCLGSPIGLFQMIKNRTIAARKPDGLPSESPLNPVPDVKFPSHHLSPVTGHPFSVSSPKVGQLFNIFHPSDPISYRLEPLISPKMKQLKPQVLPSTKKGIFGGVEAASQGLTEIGNKVGQSVSGLWSSLSAGIATNILSRNSGAASEEISQLADSSLAHEEHGRGTSSTSGRVIPEVSRLDEKMEERKRQLADSTVLNAPSSPSGNAPTLIDDELETLYAQFQKSQTGKAQGGPDQNKPGEEDHKARKMRIEEGKVRALNRNGRVDYSIPESVLDFNPMNTIASHISYWSDEDVNHFILSQLLSHRPSEDK